MRRRVKITGIGPVTPAGIGREAFFKGINEPVSRVNVIERHSLEKFNFIGADITQFDLKDFAPGEQPRRLSRHTQLGLAAAILAVRDAGLIAEQVNSLKPSVFSGTSLMDMERISREIQNVTIKGSKFSTASSLYESSVVNVPGKIASHLGLNAGIFAVQTSCCAGLDAIGQAFDLVADGQCDLAIAGGSEAPLSYHPMLEFNAAGLNPISTEDPARSCRPFDLWRTTGVLGEGSAMVILEPESSTRPAYAWITGYGYANDADGLAGEGIATAALIALANAKRRPVEVDFISAWGPGHRLIDLNEASAMRRVYGDSLPEIAATSIKGAIGTPLAAAGPIQVASAALSIRHEQIPPTVNWNSPDPQCSLNLSPCVRFLRPKVVAVNSHGMSGSNSVLILERP